MSAWARGPPIGLVSQAATSGDLVAISAASHGANCVEAESRPDRVEVTRWFERDGQARAILAASLSRLNLSLESLLTVRSGLGEAVSCCISLPPPCASVEATAASPKDAENAAILAACAELDHVGKLGKSQVVAFSESFSYLN